MVLVVIQEVLEDNLLYQVRLKAPSAKRPLLGSSLTGFRDRIASVFENGENRSQSGIIRLRYHEQRA